MLASLFFSGKLSSDFSPFLLLLRENLDRAWYCTVTFFCGEKQHLISTLQNITWVEWFFLNQLLTGLVCYWPLPSIVATYAILAVPVSGHLVVTPNTILCCCVVYSNYNFILNSWHQRTYVKIMFWEVYTELSQKIEKFHTWLPFQQHSTVVYTAS